MTENKIIEKCKRGNRKAQKLLYDLYSAQAIRVCSRYARNIADSEDMMIEGFYKVLNNIEKFNSDKNFSKWFNTIIVNNAINYYKRESKHYYTTYFEDINETQIVNTEQRENNLKFSPEDLIKALNKLPDGQREIFNLYSIEGYRHKEISEILKIKESTSRSQYIRAKSKLKSILSDGKK